ncbi:hypothetical protein JCM8097_008987 [Rhodosporidiobolus ruineniae]
MAAARSSSSYLATAGKIALATTGVLAVATVGYAAYFDYRRRNDPVFRKKLLREHKKVNVKAKKQEEAGKGAVQAALRRAIALVHAEKVPETAEGKEQFFMEQVSLGEQLAARSPEFFVASAISFYKALKVYPAPQELLMIYQKTQPQAVFDLVMELISLEINDAAQAQLRSGNQDPLLEEIAALAGQAPSVAGQGAKEDEEDEEEIVVGSGAAPAAQQAPSVSSEASEASPSSGSSFVHVESDAVVTPAGEVVAEETTAVAADVEAVVEAVEEEIAEAVEAVEEKLEEKAGEDAAADPAEPTLAA